jgi:hypothetical protein
MPLIVENVMNKARLVCVFSTRYKLRHIAASIVMAYLPQLARCGKTFLVS